MPPINLGIIGTVAQAGQAVVVSAPTNVSIATSSSGNYDNSSATHVDNCGFTEGTSSGAMTSNARTVDVDVNTMSQAFTGCDSSYSTEFRAYARHTGGTSFAWDLVLVSSSLASGVTVSTTNSPSTSQDATGNGGITEILTIAFGGGRGGVIYPADGDEIIVDLKLTVTNAGGSTNATSQRYTFNFVAL
jgi:hypothetical protein